MGAMTDGGGEFPDRARSIFDQLRSERGILAPDDGAPDGGSPDDGAPDGGSPGDHSRGNPPPPADEGPTGSPDSIAPAAIDPPAPAESSFPRIAVPLDLAGAEIELVPVFSRELRLRRALETIEADFDFVPIDCPPSLGLLTVNALAAAGEVLVPIQCEYYALEGLSQLLRNVNLVKSNLNQRLEVSTIVLTMYDARTKLAEQVADEVREHFGERVCRNVVPRTVRLSEAPSFGQPVTTFDPSSRGAIAYRELAKEVSGGAPQRVR